MNNSLGALEDHRAHNSDCSFKKIIWTQNRYFFQKHNQYKVRYSQLFPIRTGKVLGCSSKYTSEFTERVFSVAGCLNSIRKIHTTEKDRKLHRCPSNTCLLYLPDCIPPKNMLQHYEFCPFCSSISWAFSFLKINKLMLTTVLKTILNQMT